MAGLDITNALSRLIDLFNLCIMTKICRATSKSNLCSRCKLSLVIILILFAFGATKNEKNDDAKPTIVFIVLSQTEDFHVQEATKFREHFEKQLSNLPKSQWPMLYFTHDDFIDVRGAWTIFPLIEEVMAMLDQKYFSWIFLCEEDTRVNISNLQSALQTFDASKELFLGRELRDEHSTIIHHFAFAHNPSQFAYPDFRAGFVMSMPLVELTHQRLQKEKLNTDFSIDPKHELAVFLWNGGKGVNLTIMKGFCSVDESWNPKCITTQPFKFPSCGPPLDETDFFVAVKTCKLFHDSRIPVVKSTWGKEFDNIAFFSEEVDKNIPTIDLNVPNTERGHCGKTMAIIKYIVDNPRLTAISWVLIADDDTIVNLDLLRHLLACYSSEHPIALGERYGYGVARGGGYDYITGGGGMVFSHKALRLLAQRCKCYSDDAPDDMTIGMCLKSIGVPVTHSRYFHQARPDDYSPAFLANQIPVSFHKHWNNDPYKVYADLTDKSVMDKVRSLQKEKKQQVQSPNSNVREEQQKEKKQQEQSPNVREEL